jgi:hypothetical protein
MADERRVYQKITIRRGSLSNLPNLAEAEPAITKDSFELFVGGFDGDPNILLSRTAPETLLAMDYANKNQVVFNKISGTGVVIFDEASPSSIGTGSFAITGTGVWEIDRLVPFGPAEGIGGYADFRSSSGTATVSFGATFYDADGVELSFNAVQNNFIANASISNAVFQHARSSVIKGEGAIAGTVQTGARWMKPRIEVSSNSGVLNFDNFMIVPVRPVSAIFNIV